MMMKVMKIIKQIQHIKKKRANKIILFLCFSLSINLFLFINNCYAKNLGAYGATFEIIEKDFKEFIYERLYQLQQNGILDKFNKRFVSNVKEHILRPMPVQGLTTIDKDSPKTFYYDPTYVLKEDIRDENGKVLAPKGVIINPFDVITLHSVWLFFNADDKKQIKWAKEEAKKHNYVKYILVQGNIKDTSNALKDRVYFDQYGAITKQLGIKHIPCVVQQKDKKLRIQEFSFGQVDINKINLKNLSE